MKKGLIVVLVLAGVALALGGYYLSKKSQKNENLNLEEATESTPSTPEVTTPGATETTTPPTNQGGDSSMTTPPATDDGQANMGGVDEPQKDDEGPAEDIPEDETEEDLGD